MKSRKQIIKLCLEYLNEGVTIEELQQWIKQLIITENIKGTDGVIVCEKELIIAINHYKFLRENKLV